MKTNFILFHYYLFSILDLIYLDFSSLGKYIFYLGMILLAGRALRRKEILDISAKATGVIASAIVIADKLTGGGSSSTPEDKDKNNQNKKDSKDSEDSKNDENDENDKKTTSK